MRNLLGSVILAGAILLTHPFGVPAAVIKVVDFESAPRMVKYDLPHMVTIHPGDEYSAAELERNRRLLQASGLFRTIGIDAAEEEDGWRVIIRAVPYELVEKVSVAGNFFILKKNLTRILKLKVGDPFREESAREDAMALLRVYEEDGYRGTQVQTEIRRGQGGIKVTLRDYSVEIAEGGTDAVVKVTIVFTDEKKNKVIAAATSPDILVASVNAFEKAYNLLWWKNHT